MRGTVNYSLSVLVGQVCQVHGASRLPSGSGFQLFSCFRYFDFRSTLAHTIDDDDETASWATLQLRTPYRAALQGESVQFDVVL